MKLLHVAAASVNTTPLDWELNTDIIIEAIETAKENNVELLLLPELVISGYGCEDFFHANGTLEAVERELERIVKATKGITVALGLPFQFRQRLYNGVAMIVDGKLEGVVAKQNLANEGIHYESRWFEPWITGESDQFTLAGFTVPVGDLIFEIDGVRIGFEICEDAWVAHRPGRALANQGVDIILNPSASHFSFEKHEVRKRFILEGSRAFSVTYIYANLLGNEAGRVIYDGGSSITSKGKMLNESKRFSYNDYEIVDHVVDLTPQFTRKKENGTDKIREVIVPYKFIQDNTFEVTKNVQPLLNRFEEFSLAVTLGMFDYLRKSYSRGIMLSLSGGADSTAVAVIVWLMYKRGLTEAPEIFDKKLAYFLNDTKPENYMNKLLSTLYQATRNSGEVTLNAAKTIAEAVGAEFHNWSVDEEMCSYTKKVEALLGRDTKWETDDLALQNIQARVRVPGLWMVANIRNALLVSTSNRSEAAVGYATMDGDTSGGISPLAGIDKAFLLKWLKWMESDGLDHIGALPALKVVTALKPTAELRPQESVQSDEDDLMPYVVLERLEKLAIRDKKYPKHCLLLLGSFFPEVEQKQRVQWVVRFFRLWARNQWKRERYAPSFHFDDINLDPKSFCRFPILSGGFKRELYEIENSI